MPAQLPLLAGSGGRPMRFLDLLDLVVLRVSADLASSADDATEAFICRGTRCDRADIADSRRNPSRPEVEADANRSHHRGANGTIENRRSQGV